MDKEIGINDRGEVDHIDLSIFIDLFNLGIMIFDFGPMCPPSLFKMRSPPLNVFYTIPNNLLYESCRK